MLQPLPTPDEIAVWEKETISTIGIPGLTLMESASRQVVSILLEEYGQIDGANIFCFAGAGNNAGDTFAIARQLQDLGGNVTVFHSKNKKQYRGDTRKNLIWAHKLDVPFRHIGSSDLSRFGHPDIVIDGLLGTGFQGPLRKDFLELVQFINIQAQHAYILSVDLPSGLNGLTGLPDPEAVRATCTVTFEAPKLGLVFPEAQKYTGKIHVCGIGIPKSIQRLSPPRHYLISHEAMDNIPKSSPDIHKGKAGRILIIGGSLGLTGAPHLAAMGALRSGAGLVTIACPGGLMSEIKAGSPDIMIFPLGKGEHWTPGMAETLLENLSDYDAVVVGPGLGRAPKTVDFLKGFIAQCTAQTVLDADALFGISHFPEMLKDLTDSMILTPHPGEMATLMHTSIQHIQKDRLACSRQFVDRSNATLVLKGAGTLISNTTMTCLSPFAEPNLAVGGSGDVLSGIIASLVARDLNPFTAACTAVYWHGFTGRLLKNEFPARGNLATDIANRLPQAVKQHTKEFSSC